MEVQEILIEFSEEISWRAAILMIGKPERRWRVGIKINLVGFKAHQP
jgi:hypothetical protein